MLRVDQAQARIFETIEVLSGESVEIAASIDRSIVNAITVTRTLPPWDNSAMDGYAVRFADLPGALKVTQTIFAGDRPTLGINAGECARIMTGAVVPHGADTVVMQEHTRPEGDRIAFDQPTKPGANIRRRGEDVREGETLFERGRAISLADAGSLWSQGLTHVAVVRRPRVAIVSSGDELVDVGQPLAEDRIVDSNTPVISAAVARAGGLAIHRARAADTLESITSHFDRALSGELDALITIAGASVGERDFTHDALRSLGVENVFTRVAMKPGKPFFFGRRGKTFVFGLPGNPVSAMVTFELFVRPALRAMQGLRALPPHGTGWLGAPLRKQPGLRHFVRATLDNRGWAIPMPSQVSGALSSAAGATCLIDLEEPQGDIEAGSEIRTFPLSW